MTDVVLPTERAATLGRWIVRLVAVVVLIAGLIKVVDVASAEPLDVQYDPTVLIALAAWAVWRPAYRLPALLLAAFLLAVTLYLLTVPPGEFERYGCRCFGERFRFQDVRDHLRLGGALIVVAALGAWLAPSRV